MPTGSKNKQGGGNRGGGSSGSSRSGSSRSGSSSGTRNAGGREGSMSVREAGHMGGQRERELVQEGKQSERGGSDRNR